MVNSTRSDSYTITYTGYGDLDRYVPVYKIGPAYRPYKKLPLTPKQKKARAKAKRAKQARKINHRYLALNRWQLKKLNKKKRNGKK